MVIHCAVIHIHLTVKCSATAFGLTPGSVPRYFKISEHPIEAAKWTGCHPCYSYDQYTVRLIKKFTYRTLPYP